MREDPKKRKRSIKIPLQLRHQQGTGLYYAPYGDEAIEKSGEFALYQIVEGTLKGTKKERSIAQHGLYWACCTLVAELVSDHENIYSKEDIDFKIKLIIGQKHPWMIKQFKVVKGIAYIELISISFANMKRLEANKFFDKAFPELATLPGLTEDELIARAKARMK